MSRKGNKVIPISSGVNVQINPNTIELNGSTGKLVVPYPAQYLDVTNSDGAIKVAIKDSQSSDANMYHGTVASHIINAMQGLSKGFTKTLKIVGVGFKANIAGSKLNLAIGFSHPVVFDIPADLKVSCPTPTEIVISGYNKQAVGQFAALIRQVREPEPYNGKGIMYSDEILIRKVGKTAETAVGGGGGGSAAPAKGGKK